MRVSYPFLNVHSYYPCQGSVEHMCIVHFWLSMWFHYDCQHYQLHLLADRYLFAICFMHDHNKFITPINMKYNFLWLLPFLIIWIQMYRNEYLYLFSTHILLNIFDITTWKMITKEIPIMVKILVPKSSPASHYSAWSLSKPVLFWVGLKSSNLFSLLNDSALYGGFPSCCPLLSLDDVRWP